MTAITEDQIEALPADFKARGKSASAQTSRRGLQALGNERSLAASVVLRLVTEVLPDQRVNIRAKWPISHFKAKVTVESAFSELWRVFTRVQCCVHCRICPDGDDSL